MRLSSWNLRFRAFVAAALVLMAFGGARAGDSGLAEKYLVCVKLRNPAVFRYEGYLKKCFYKNGFAKYKEEFAKEWERDPTPDDIKDYWEEQFKDFTVYSKNDFSSVFQSNIVIRANGNLSGLIGSKDTGEGIPCAVDEDGKYTNNTASQNNIPFAVESVKNGEIELRETLSGESSSFGENVWRNYFWMNNQWHVPATREIWLTSWDDLSKHWDDWLSGGNHAEIREQMKAIKESERFKQEGGNVWKEKIDNYYKSNAIMPHLVLWNRTGGVREGEVSWWDGDKCIKREIIQSMKEVNNRVTFQAPFKRVDDSMTLSAKVSLWIPGRSCCGSNTWKGVFQDALAPDIELNAESSNEDWETKDIADITVRLFNTAGRNCKVKFKPSKNNKEVLFLNQNDVFTARIKAHTNGVIVVEYAGKSIKEVEFDDKRAHRGASLEISISLPEDEKPEITKASKMSIPGRDDNPDDLIHLSIGKNYAFMEGVPSDYANGSDLKNYTNVNDINMIIVEVKSGSNDSDTLRKFVADYLKEIKVPARYDETHRKWYIKAKNPEEGQWIEIPSQNKSFLNMEECLKFLDAYKSKHKLEDVQKFVSELKKAMPTWGDNLDAYADSLKPKVEFVNCTGTNIILVINGSDISVSQDGTHTNNTNDIKGNNVLVREDGFDDDEYVNNSIILTPGVTSIDIKAADYLKHKPNPRLVVKLPFRVSGSLRGRIREKFAARELDFVDVTEFQYPLNRMEAVTNLLLKADGYEKVDLFSSTAVTWDNYKSAIQQNGLKYGATATITVYSLEREQQSDNGLSIGQEMESKGDGNVNLPTIDGFWIGDIRRHLELLDIQQNKAKKWFEERNPIEKEGRTTRKDKTMNQVYDYYYKVYDKSPLDALAAALGYVLGHIPHEGKLKKDDLENVKNDDNIKKIWEKWEKDVNIQKIWEELEKKIDISKEGLQPLGGK